jgi:hypothetical protein
LRTRKGKIEAGSISPLQHGKPISGDVVQLVPRKESAALFDVKTLHTSTRPKASTEDVALNRPARVANDKYRKGWDQVFAKRRPSSLLN